MEKKILLTILSTQCFQEEAPESSKLVTQGEMCVEEEVIRLSYWETELTGLVGTKTTFCIEKDRVILERSGALQSKMTFMVGKEDQSLYDMGFGALMITVRTESIESGVTEEGGVLKVSYGISVEEETAGKITYEITVQPI